MLPQLITNKRQTHKNSHEKLPASQKDVELQAERTQKSGYYRDRNNAKSISAKKVRTGGGFNKYPVEQPSDINLNKNINAFNSQDKYAKFQKMKFSGNNLAAEIKMIEKKIKMCQKKLEEDKKRQKQLAQEATKDREDPQYDFQRVVKREIQMQGYYQADDHNQMKNFDYLTNPGGKPVEEEQVKEEPKPVVQLPKQYNIDEGLEKLEKHYENNLKRKFQRRQMFPHQACRRKTPKLYISHKTNTLNKYGKASNEAEHLFRVYTKQTTPQQIYPTIPNFAVVKDNLSKNIVAYLGDYKPFIEKTKNQNGEPDEIQPNDMMTQSKNAHSINTQSERKRQIENLGINGEQFGIL